MQYGIVGPEDGGYTLEGPGVVFTDDEGWLYMPSDNDTLEVYYSLKEKITDRGYMLYADGNMYFYKDTARQ